MMSNLKDKVVLITGAGKGAGRALAIALAGQGAFLAVNDISPNNVEELASEIIARGGRARAFIEDVAKKVGAQFLVKSTEDELGGIDILVNHAAVQPHVSLLDMDEWDWHRTLDVNLTGAFLMTQSAGRIMREKGKGVILNIVAGRGESVKKDAGAYLLSKAALLELSHQTKQELGPYGIAVHAVENSADIINEAMSILENIK
jgi:NAD(P)-dependent dehydrogenase (short-subunit alcohol dehydrogenase family)